MVEFIKVWKPQLVCDRVDLSAGKAEEAHAACFDQ